MKNRFAFAASTLLLACANSFGQAGSPDQAAFNRAVMNFKVAVDEELSKIQKAVAEGDGEATKSNPIRKNKISSDAARESAVRVSLSAAAVQTRAARLGADEWFGVVGKIMDHSEHVKGGTSPLPSRYSMQVAWSPDVSDSVDPAVTAVQKSLASERFIRNEDKAQNLIWLTLWINEDLKDLVDAAAKVNPADCVLFTIDHSGGRELRVSRSRNFIDGREFETTLFRTANLNRKHLFSLMMGVMNIHLGMDDISLHLHPSGYIFPDKEQHAIDVPSAMYGLELKSIRVIADDAAKKRSKAATALSEIIDRVAFTEKVKAAIPADQRPDMEPWLDKLTDSPERLLYEAQSRVFEYRATPERAKLTKEVANFALTDDAPALKPAAICTLALAELRNDRPGAALEILEQLSKLEPAPELDRLGRLMKCLAEAMQNSEDAVKNAIAFRDSIDSDTTAVLDYRALAILTELQAKTGVEASEGDKPIEIKFNWGAPEKTGK